ncbi:MAG: hypothetical protein IPM83_17040 [Ignavibacteria bacterium]|nr:hypothetical protein [Ignavibacteria bacterium]
MNQGNDNGQPDSSRAGADGIAVVLKMKPVPLSVSRVMVLDTMAYHMVLAIEFDSYLNAAFSDPLPSHVGVQMEITWVTTLARCTCCVRLHQKGCRCLADGTIYFCESNVGGKRLFVYCSTTQDLGEPLLVVDSIDINEILRLRADGACYVGFTSSTGKSSQIHEFLSLEIEGCSPLVSSTEDEAEGSGSSFVDIGPTISPIPASSIANLRLKRRPHSTLRP